MSNNLFAKQLRDSYNRILKFITKSLRNVDGPLTVNGTLTTTGVITGDGSGLTGIEAAGAVTALNNQAESRLVSIGSTTTQLDGEANITYDGTTFSVDDAATFNDSGGDNDFRVEGDSETHLLFLDASTDRISIGDSVDDPAATLEVTNASDGGVPLIQLNSNDTDKIAIDINAANIDADVFDITADAVTTAIVMDITADALTTGGILNLVSDSSTTNTRRLVFVSNDNTAAVGTTVMHLKNDAIAAGDPILLVESSAAETGPLLELRNSNAATGKPPILAFNRTDDSAEADDMQVGRIEFSAVDSGNSEVEYVRIIASATDITDNDEGGEIKFQIQAGGTAGTAGLKELLTIGGEDVANTTPCAVTINEGGIDCDFRVESNDQTSALFVDAGNNEIQINSRTANATGGGFDGAAGVTQYVSKVNGEIITTILIDIEDLYVGGATGDIIGENGVAAAYITQITTAVNGIVYKAEMSCIEVPAGTNTIADIDLSANSNSLAEDATVQSAGTPTAIITSGAAWTAGMSRTSAVGADFTNLVNDYLYIVAGTNTQSGGQYTAGKFVIKLYGASF